LQDNFSFREEKILLLLKLDERPRSSSKQEIE
jgi:hypothetical protein